MRYWSGSATPRQGSAASPREILNRVWLLFKENGIEFPNPQRDIHVKEWPEPPPAGS